MTCCCLVTCSLVRRRKSCGGVTMQKSQLQRGSGIAGSIWISTEEPLQWNAWYIPSDEYGQSWLLLKILPLENFQHQPFSCLVVEENNSNLSSTVQDDKDRPLVPHEGQVLARISLWGSLEVHPWRPSLPLKGLLLACRWASCIWQTRNGWHRSPVLC